MLQVLVVLQALLFIEVVSVLFALSLLHELLVFQVFVNTLCTVSTEGAGTLRTSFTISTPETTGTSPQLAS